MADPQPNPPETEQSSYAPAEPESSSKLPMVIGLAVVIVVIIAFIIFGRGGSSENANQQDPYISKLQISNQHMATAENFAGGSVTYILGTVANTGDKKLSGARVQVLFKNSLGEIAQKETLPLTVLLPNSPYVDYAPLDRAPLGAGQQRDFRLTLEHVTADWDGQVPQIKVVSVTY
ncbi:MAG TPA: hypothetical protein VE783_11700 [Candidatus Limnocylindrales bacterium]|nr:hypothetical protein [Candidatus Limnocylindrales bacterium]